MQIFYKNSFKKNFLNFLKLFIILALIIFSYYLYRFIYLDNFRVVIPGSIYRSAQPSLIDIDEYEQKYGIKSLLNLRGFKTKGEIKLALDYSKAHGIETHSVQMSASRLPSVEKLNSAIEFINNSPKPLLIHCRQGVDRTGLISAVALLLNNYTVEQALEQMTWDKGFLPYREQDILKNLLFNYSNWLEQNNLTTNKDNFMFWAKNLYKPN